MSSFVGGLLWLIWTNNQVNENKLRVSVLIRTIESKEQQIQRLEEDLTQLNNYLHEADNFATYKIDISPEDRKYYLYTGEIPEQVQLVFRRIIDSQNEGVKFSLYGETPGQGFNSPSFITYILNEERIAESVRTNSSELSYMFEKVYDNYRSGDLLIYKSGYCMMYFTNNYTDTGSFVIGMTPSGILALKQNFAEEIAHLRPNYHY
ncbi:MAG: hypothetical protein AAF363_13890 [Bacteroidota bacterium]